MARKKCSNPLGHTKHVCRTKNLQPPTRILLEFCEGRVQPDALLCMKCSISMYQSKKSGETIHQLIKQHEDADSFSTTIDVQADK